MSIQWVVTPWYVRLYRAAHFPWMIWKLYMVGKNLRLSIRLFHHWVWYDEAK